MIELEQVQSPTQDIQFHDPDGQQWRELESKERRDRILHISREGFLLPNERNTLIYHGGRGPSRLVEPVAVKRFGGEPDSTSALNRENTQCAGSAYASGGNRDEAPFAKKQK